MLLYALLHLSTPLLQKGQWNDYIDSLEEEHDHLFDTLCEHGFDMAEYMKDTFIHPLVEQASSDLIEQAARRDADAYLETLRPTKRRRGNESVVVPLGADGYKSVISTVGEHADVDILGALDDSNPLPNDEMPDRVAVYKEEDDMRGITDPSVLNDTGAIWHSGFRLSLGVMSTLKPHQLQLATRILDNFDCKRGILAAHTMGLGKSLSLLVAVDAYTNRHRCTKTVLLCPKAMIKPWQDEVNKWNDILDIDIFSVPSNESSSVLRSTRTWSKHGGILVVGHDQYRMIQPSLDVDDSTLLVVDEAHLLKSSATLLYSAVSSTPTSMRVFLTGTPLQNHLEEYYHMMQLISPGLLGKTVSEFKIKYGNDIEAGMTSDATPVQIVKSEQRVQVLRWMVQSFMDDASVSLLRDAVPPKTEFCIFHPCKQIDSSYSPLTVRHEVHEASRLFKVNVVETLVKTIFSRTNESVVVFSSRNDTLQAIKDRMGGMLFTGKTGDDARCKVLDDFNENGGLLLVATKAGGVGLNLTRASRVIIADVAWNPVYDTQAVSRAWRMGQERNVFVYRLVAADTIETGIYNLNLHKHMLAARVMEDQDVNRLLSSSDLKDTTCDSLPLLDSASLSVLDDVLLHSMTIFDDKHFVTSHNSLFLDTDAELSVNEQSEAIEEYNNIVSLNPRELQAPNGCYYNLSPEQEYFPGTDDLVPAHPPSVRKLTTKEDETRHRVIIKSRGPSASVQIRYREENWQEWDTINKPDSAPECILDLSFAIGSYMFESRSVVVRNGEKVFGPWSNASASVIVE
jgi:superfamily II DNA or RNA helicase